MSSCVCFVIVFWYSILFWDGVLGLLLNSSGKFLCFVGCVMMVG